MAERGSGTWALKDSHLTRVYTSDVSQMMIVEEGKASGQRREQAAQYMAAVIRKDRWDFRSIGSTLSFPYLAAGRVSAYIVFWYTPALHAAAGSLLATEAGCVLTDVFGNPWTLESDSLLAAATPELHKELLSLHP